MSDNNLVKDILGQLPNHIVKPVVPYKGAMIYDHKTSGTIQVMDGDSWSNWKGYQPGRNGRRATKKAGAINTCHI